MSRSMSGSKSLSRSRSGSQSRSGEDNPFPTFTMQSAQSAMEGGLTHIEEHVRGIERAIIENPGLAFDLSKTLIESVCCSVLTERGITHGVEDNVPKLFKEVTSNLPLLPPAAHAAAETRQSLKKTLSGLHTAVQGGCELRNQCGFASHGSDSTRIKLEPVQALLAAQAADAIVGFIYQIHIQSHTSPATPESPLLIYETNQAFNSFIDDSNEIICILDSQFRPSEVLFQMDPESYRVALAEFDNEEPT